MWRIHLTEPSIECATKPNFPELQISTQRFETNYSVKTLNEPTISTGNGAGFHFRPGARSRARQTAETIEAGANNGRFANPYTVAECTRTIVVLEEEDVPSGETHRSLSAREAEEHVWAVPVGHLSQYVQQLGGVTGLKIYKRCLVMYMDRRIYGIGFSIKFYYMIVKGSGYIVLNLRKIKFNGELRWRK